MGEAVESLFEGEPASDEQGIARGAEEGDSDGDFIEVANEERGDEVEAEEEEKRGERKATSAGCRCFCHKVCYFVIGHSAMRGVMHCAVPLWLGDGLQGDAGIDFQEFCFHIVVCLWLHLEVVVDILLGEQVDGYEVLLVDLLLEDEVVGQCLDAVEALQ